MSSLPSTPSELAALIDHTLLRPDAGENEIAQLCAEATQYRFATVCIQPCRVKLAAQQLSGCGTRVCSVVGFPHGATPTAVKVFEARMASDEGAQELDMVMNIGAARDADWDWVETDIRAVVAAANARRVVVKVILECALLSEEEKRRAAEITAQSGAAFVKTSTGYASHGALVEDVRLLRSCVGDRCGVKAAGGIRELPVAMEMLKAGANRLGCSAGIALIEQMKLLQEKA